MHNNGLRRVALCITTYKRPELLSRCLLAIDSIEMPSALKPIILVVDNDHNGSAEKVCADAARHSLFSLYYCIEPRLGLCFGRNRLLQEALRHQADFIAFIDDDEMPHRHWLKNIYRGLISRDVDIVTGPVVSILATMPPEEFVIKKKWKTEKKAKYANAGNVLFKIKLVSELGLVFDDYYNFIGGEDHDFFGRARHRDCQIAYVADAIMFEFLLPERRTFKYRLYRHYSSGINYVLHYKYRRSTVFAWLYFIPRVLGKLASAIICFFCAAAPGKRQSYLNKVAIKLAAAIGYIAGLLGIVEERYRID